MAYRSRVTCSERSRPDIFCWVLACRLTFLFLDIPVRHVRFRVLPDVVAGGRAAVLRTWRAPGSGFAGFRCTGRRGGLRADVPEPAADPRRGEPARRGGFLPGAAQIAGEMPGEAQLGMAGDD